jgi:hypothetical protein
VDAQDIICAVTVVFIVGMIWLRTRMQYARKVRGVLQMQTAGRLYYAAAAAVLVLGWIVAPLLGRLLVPETNVTPGLTRVIWFLATYYVFIVVHRILQAKGVQIYKAAAS